MQSWQFIAVGTVWVQKETVALLFATQPATVQISYYSASVCLYQYAYTSIRSHNKHVIVLLINRSAYLPSHLGSMTQSSMMMFTKGWQALFCNWIGKISIRWLLLFNTWHLPSVSLTRAPAFMLWTVVLLSMYPSSSPWRCFWLWWLLSRCSTFYPPTSCRPWSTRNNKP